MDPADEALIEAWNLFIEDPTDEIEKRFDELLPSLFDAGYAESEPVEGDADIDEIWRFTEKGVQRAEELVPDEDLA